MYYLARHPAGGTRDGLGTNLWSGYIGARGITPGRHLFYQFALYPIYGLTAFFY